MMPCASAPRSASNRCDLVIRSRQNCSSRSASSAKVAVNEPGDSAKARKRTSRYTDHSDSSSTRTVISVMIHFVPLRRDRRALFPLLDVRSSVRAAGGSQPLEADGPDAGVQVQAELVNQVELHERPPEADAAPDHDVAVAAAPEPVDLFCRVTGGDGGVGPVG